MTGSYVYPGTELQAFWGASTWKRYLKDTVEPYVRGDVLEVGAGLGAATRVLCAGPPSSWLCLEPDAGLAARLAADLATEPLPVIPFVRTGTVEDLGDETFDTILYVDVLEHIREDRRELAVACRHLRRDGHLVVICPAHEWLSSTFDRAVGHHRRYTRRSLAEVVPSGMITERLRYLDSLGIVLSATNRLILRSRSPSAWQVRFWDRWVIPISRRVDPLFGFGVGKTIVGVWRAPPAPSVPAAPPVA